MITAKRSSNIHEDTVLERNSMRNDGTFGVIDDLSVNYDGNRLLNVTDDAESLNYNGALDFNDGADMTAEYEYDSTSALTKDRNRGITGITYDLGHNPQTIVMNGGQIVNDYTSDGLKLCSTQSTGMTTTTDMYVDGLIIRNGAPLMWQFNGGYVALGTNSVPQSWNYYITDHLGSTRMVVDSRNIIKETINYYPFGSEMTMTPPAQLTSNPNWQPYRFTGKELVRQNGLNMYDFGARWYDVAGVPMWTSMDPLCEKNYPVTPYSYCNGDPVNAIDPDGEKVYVVATTLPGAQKFPFATHTYTLVTGHGNPQRYAYGSDKDGISGIFSGNLERCYYIDDEKTMNAALKYIEKNDYNEKLPDNIKNIIEIEPPAGISSDRFDHKVMNVAEQFDNNKEIQYNVLTNSDKTGNCNTSTTTLLIKSGVPKEKIDEIGEQLNGIVGGWGEIRPWTEEERKKAINEH